MGCSDPGPATMASLGTLHGHRVQGLSPSQAQRDFSHSIAAIGTPARPPKPQEKSPGRPRDYRLFPRQCRNVVRKSKKKRKKDF